MVGIRYSAFLHSQEHRQMHTQVGTRTPFCAQFVPTLTGKKPTGLASTKQP